MLDVALISSGIGFVVGVPVGRAGRFAGAYALKGQVGPALAAGAGAALGALGWSSIAAVAVATVGPDLPFAALRVAAGGIFLVIGMGLWAAGRARAALPTPPVLPIKSLVVLTLSVSLANPTPLALYALLLAEPITTSLLPAWQAAAVVGPAVAVGSLLASAAALVPASLLRAHLTAARQGLAARAAAASALVLGLALTAWGALQLAG